MKEIQGNDLQPGKVYYIESINVAPYSNKRSRQKGVFKKFLPGNDDYGEYLDQVHFESVENINKDDNSDIGTGTHIYPHMYERNHPDRDLRVYISGRMFYHTDYYRFYACEKDEIIERKEMETTNILLQQIIGVYFNF